jgi:hypothetical protein
LPLEGANAPDPETEPTVPLEPAGAAGGPQAGAAGGPQAGAAGGPQAAQTPAPAPPQSGTEPSGYIGREREHSDVDEHSSVDLARLAWLVTVGACLIAVAILVVQGYYGYAAVTFAVAASAALNLT